MTIIKKVGDKSENQIFTWQLGRQKDDCPRDLLLPTTSSKNDETFDTCLSHEHSHNYYNRDWHRFFALKK